MSMSESLSRRRWPSAAAVFGRAFADAQRRRWPPVTVAFGLAFAGTLLVAILQSPKTFYFDSGRYWLLGESFTLNGHFSLLNFASAERAYALPLIDHGLQVIASDLSWSSSSLAKLFNALVVALIGAVLAPRFAEIVWPKQRWGLIRRLALTVPLVAFWSGYLNFPLSDFLALALALLTLVGVARADAPVWMLLAGFTCGLAVDVRAAYVLLIPIALGLVAWSWFESRGQGRSIAVRAFCLGLFVTGFVIVSLPQSLTAHRHFGTWSFMPGATTDLSSTYLTPGLSEQLVEGYVGPDHPPLISYGDAAGLRLLRAQPGGKVDGMGQYAGLIVSHPLTMGGLLIRHIVNSLDPRYSTPYIEHLNVASHLWLRILGFLLVFLALVRVLWSTARRRLGPARWRYMAALLLCSASSITAPAEPRYLLPVYLASYILVLAPGWPNPIGPRDTGLSRFRTLAVLSIASLAFAAVIWHVVNATSSQMHFG